LHAVASVYNAGDTLIKIANDIAHLVNVYLKERGIYATDSTAHATGAGKASEST